MRRRCAAPPCAIRARSDLSRSSARFGVRLGARRSFHSASSCRSSARRSASTRRRRMASIRRCRPSARCVSSRLFRGDVDVWRRLYRLLSRPPLADRRGAAYERPNRAAAEAARQRYPFSPVPALQLPLRLGAVGPLRGAGRRSGPRSGAGIRRCSFSIAFPLGAPAFECGRLVCLLVLRLGRVPGRQLTPLGRLGRM